MKLLSVVLVILYSLIFLLPVISFGEEDKKYPPLFLSLTYNQRLNKNIVTWKERQWSKSSAPTKLDRPAAIDYCNQLSLDGKSDWRLPYYQELTDLVYCSNGKKAPFVGNPYSCCDNPPDCNTYTIPTISAQFNCRADDFYWSSTYTNKFYEFQFYGRSFGDGSEDRPSSDYIPGWVRCIRDLPEKVVNSQGHDWLLNTSPDKLPVLKASDYCQSAIAEGHDDWRLPTKDELKSLVVCSNGQTTPLNDRDTCCTNATTPCNYQSPTIDQEFLPYILSTSYWTSTTGDGSGTGWPDEWFFYLVNFSNGESDDLIAFGEADILEARVLCIR